MNENNDFIGFDKVKPAPPPLKIKPVKPSKQDLMIYYHGRTIPQPLPEHYSYSHIKKVLYDKYELFIEDVSPYKWTRYGKQLKIYRVFNAVDDTVLNEVTLYQIACYLREQGDY